jgi:hypothetical protein
MSKHRSRHRDSGKHRRGDHGDHGHPGPGSRGRDRRRGGGRGQAGPKICPMCGAVVPDLGSHIRSRHDDAESHPTD